MSAFIKITLRILCGAVVGALLGYQVAAEPVPELVTLNEHLIAVVRNDTVRRDHSGGQVPGEIQSAIGTLQRNGIPIFNTLPELASATDVREAIIQEYYRMQGDWGMPWLPLSWSVQGLHSEAVVSEVETAIRAQFERAPLPMSDDQLLLLFLYSGSIFHTTRGSDHINDLRNKAEVLAQADRSFYDIRLEIHQEPSLATIRRVREWIANLPSSSRGRRGQAEEILRILEDLFGNADIETYLRLNPVDGTSHGTLTAAASRIVEIRDASDLAGMEAVLPRVLATVEALAVRAKAVSDEVRSVPGACGGGTPVPACKHLKMDLVKQLTRAQFVIGNAFLQKAGETGLRLSLDSVLKLSKGFVLGSVATGMMPQGAILAMDAADEAVRRAAAAGPVPVATVLETFSAIEQLASEAYRRARGLFAAQLAKYSRFVPQADRFIDDMVRASNLLPLSNLTASVVPAVQELSGARLRVDGALVSGGHRVLNPGIGRGRLVILDEASLMNEEYSWNPDFIYVLTKTPAWLQKVAGIITCDSGSMISHVQLLASNHGLPNVKISCGILPRLQAIAGQEILLISLPNGEVRITPVSSSSAEERQVHAEYTNARARLKVRLPRPSRLDINYPVRLEQLRMDDSGKVAGGKACGQGELAAVFPDRVPRAIVLPFGVYYDHVVRTGIYAEIQATLGDATLRGHEREVVERRKAALAQIRARIEAIQLLPEIEEYLIRVLMAEPFRGRGVFVRSDTNAEDLPGFVGAGLNKTVPNVVGVANILQAVKSVWASPFSEKAFTWRDDLIENPWDIFPSIVIQLAVNSDKAGIMVVGDPLEDDYDDHVFLAANEGLGITAVNGEYMPEELIYSRRESRVIRLRQAYAPERKRLLPGGGIANLPVLGLNPILTDAEAAGFAEIGDTIQDHLYRTYGDREKWDLEWGVSEGRLVLFQIRTFVGNKVARNFTALRRLETDVRGAARAGVPFGDATIGIISATAR